MFRGVLPGLIGLVTIILAVLAAPSAATAQSAKPSPKVIPVYLFWSRSCPHCTRAFAFLEKLAASNKKVRLRTFEVENSRGNMELFLKVNEYFGVKRPAVPVIIVGGNLLVGYGDDQNSGRAIITRVRACLDQPCPDPIAALVKEKKPPPAKGIERPKLPPTLDLPLIGKVRTVNISLPLLTIVLGAVDGFNPCAMWALVFLIGLLLGLNNRRRMWLLGGVFLATTALVYFAILAAWLNVLLFLGALLWIRVVVAIVAIGGGSYYLREFTRGEVVCKVTAHQSRRHVLERLKAAATGHHLGMAIAGIAVLAVAVNLIDLLCSAGLPAVFTEVLTHSRLPAWEYYGYLALYVLVFMADDLLVFIIAMATLKLGTVSLHFARYSNLVGGILLIAIGALLLIRPEWLSFA